MGLFTPEQEKSQEAKDGRDLNRRRDPMPRILLVSLIAATVVLVSYTVRQAGRPVDITLVATAERRDEGLRVSGETSLVDGAILEVWVVADGASDVRGRNPDAEIAVASGSFDALVTADTQTRRDSLSHVLIVFEPVRVSGPQNADVLSEYGLFGENLGGNLVVETDRGQRLEQEIDIR